MDGTPGVRSVPGEGSVFWFTARLTKQLHGVRPEVKIAAELLNLHVLIVDDNETNRHILQEQTQAWKMRSTAVVDAASALIEMRRALAVNDPYQIVLLDMQMPGTSGLTLARSIKAERELAGVRILLLSSLGGRLDPTELTAAGIEDCLAKPVKQSLLFDCIATAVGRASAVDVSKPKKVSPPLASSASLPGNLGILLAEDNIVNQQVASGLLQKLGYSAAVVADGLEAMNALKRIRYDVVFMDCQMPNLDGYETTRCIRQLERNRIAPFDWKAPIRIIAMTANAMEGDCEKCLAAGMDDYLSKPVREIELKAALACCNKIAAGQVSDSSAKEPSLPAHFEKAPAPIKIPSSEETLVDFDQLLDVSGGEPDRMRRLMELYVTQTGPMLDGLTDAIDNNCSVDVARIAHKLIGSSLSCGVEAFTSPLRALERLGEEGQLAGAFALLEDVRYKFPRVQNAFSQFAERFETSTR
jgi:CheY-like chemotaxis protein/HPt (histidine-containing phosphotransfer) domain-containing protein